LPQLFRFLSVYQSRIKLSSRINLVCSITSNDTFILNCRIKLEINFATFFLFKKANPKGRGIYSRHRIGELSNGIVVKDIRLWFRGTLSSPSINSGLAQKQSAPAVILITVRPFVRSKGEWVVILTERHSAEKKTEKGIPEVAVMK